MEAVTTTPSPARASVARELGYSAHAEKAEPMDRFTTSMPSSRDFSIACSMISVVVEPPQPKTR